MTDKIDRYLITKDNLQVEEKKYTHIYYYMPGVTDVKIKPQDKKFSTIEIGDNLSIFCDGESIKILYIALKNEMARRDAHERNM